MVSRDNKGQWENNLIDTLNNFFKIDLNWGFLLFTFSIAFFIQLLTVNDVLLFYKDQVQIIDYGRLILNPSSGWSMTWLISEEKPLLIWSYIGPLLAEIGFELGGIHGAGARIMSLLGGIFAGSMAFGWLRSLNVPKYAAYCLSLAFFLDPLFVLSQRIGRVDSWVIAFCLAACWLLKSSLEKEKNRSKKYLLLGGSLAAVAGLCWPSAIFLYPLVLYELVREGKSMEGREIQSYIFRIKYFLLGGISTFVILIIPVWENLLLIFNDMTTVLTRNVDASKKSVDQILAIVDFKHWIKLGKAFTKTLTPFFPFLALAGALISKKIKLSIITLVAIWMIFSSLIYEMRALYLLPYFLILSSSIFIRPINFRLRLFLKPVLGFIVFWAVGISLVARTFFGLENKPNEYQKHIYRAAVTSIGAGDYKVFLGFTYELYFVGRSLNWQLYAPYQEFRYDDVGNWISINKYGPKEKFKELLSQMDYAVFRPGDLDKDLIDNLKSTGLHLQGYLLNKGQKKDPIDVKKGNKEIIMQYLKGGEVDDSFLLFSRQEGTFQKKGEGIGSFISANKFPKK